MPKALRQMPAPAGRAGVARGEAACEPASDEASGPRHEPNDTGNLHAALLHAAFTRENLQTGAQASAGHTKVQRVSMGWT